jgi:hypothetical protein
MATDIFGKIIERQWKRPPLRGRSIGSKTLRDKCMAEQVLNYSESEW